MPRFLFPPGPLVCGQQILFTIPSLRGFAAGIEVDIAQACGVLPDYLVFPAASLIIMARRTIAST